MPLVLSTATNPGEATFTPFGEAAANVPVFLSTAGTHDVAPTTRFIIVDVPNVAFTFLDLSLPASYPVGVPLTVVRKDSGGGTCSLVPVSGDMNDGAGASLPSLADQNGLQSAIQVMHDGTNWWTTSFITPEYIP
jgi:hypothetical protein